MVGSEVCTEADLASLFGVSPRVVRDLAARGVLKKAAPARYPLGDSIRAYCAHLREVAAARNVSTAGPGLTVERERVTKERADQLALNNARLRGELVPVIEVEARWSGILRQVRARMLAVPSRCQQRLGHLTAHDVGQIDREIRDGLTELGNGDA